MCPAVHQVRSAKSDHGRIEQNRLFLRLPTLARDQGIGNHLIPTDVRFGVTGPSRLGEKGNANKEWDYKPNHSFGNVPIQVLQCDLQKYWQKTFPNN